MKHQKVVLLSIIVLTLLAGVFFFNSDPRKIDDTSAVAESASQVDKAADKFKAAEAYGELPIHFEPNVGQTDDRVNFIARGQGYALFLTPGEAVLSLQKETTSVVRMQIDGANKSARFEGIAETNGKTNYLIGNDPQKWRTDISNFQKVKYIGVYEGIDLVYYGNGRKLEYDFIVAPNTDPDQIKLKFDGVKTFELEKQTGDLLLETGSGTIRQHKPFVYQEIDGERREIASAYKIDGTQAKFILGEYDRSKELVIDPILAYGSYLSGRAFDEGRGIAVDSQGNAYITGTAASVDFPTTAGTIKPALLPNANNQTWYDAFVTKINPTGTALVYSTYFGGRNGNESGSGIAVDGDGNALISGTTMANDLPVINAYQSTFGGTDDAFAAKLNATGSALIYSTYLGGNNTDLGARIALNSTNGEAIFVGTTSSPNFPTMPGALKERLCTGGANCSGIFYSGSYAVKLSSAGAGVYSTLFDAAITDVALDTSGNAVLAGSAGSGFTATTGAYQTATSGGVDGVVAKINVAGSALVFGTFLGGGQQSDRITSVALDSSGNIYVTGKTENTGFPVTPGAFDTTFTGTPSGADGFVTKFNPAGSALAYSTFLGGLGTDEPQAITVDQNNEAFVAGETLGGQNFPLKNSLTNSGSAFLTRLNAAGSALVYSTLLGQGGVYEVAIDSGGSAFVTGHTVGILVSPGTFQTVRNPAQSSSTKDGFVLKIAPSPDENAQTYNISGTVSGTNQPASDAPVIATITGAVNRSIVLPYSSGGATPYFFGGLPAGGNYTVTIKKAGFLTAPESETFNNLGANQFADFVIRNNQQAEGVITSPTHHQQFNAPATINIQATASDPDGHAIAKVDFVAYHSVLGSIPLGTDTEAPYEFTWSNVPVGTWALYAYPTDEIGLRGISTPTTHVIVVDPATPSVALTNPLDGQQFVEGDTIPIGVTVSSPITLVEVRDQNNDLVGRMTGAPWTTQWWANNTGSYTLTAKGFTTQGATVTSQPVNITVGPINHRISGRVVDSISFAPIANVALNLVSTTNPSITAATTTDADGRYSFTNLGTTVNDGVVITPSIAGYTFQPTTIPIGLLGYIKHWENQNFWATQQTQIAVNITSPTQGQIFFSPATVNIAANATSGAGTITKVEFFREQGALSTSLGSDTSAPFEHQLTGLTSATYRFFVRATDSTNAVKQSDTITIEVRPPTVNLSGRIIGPDGNGMAGVTVHIGGTSAWTEETDADGRYAFLNWPGAGNHTITPLPANGITFTPVSRSYTNVTSDITNIDFVGSSPNQAPTLTQSAPADGAVYTLMQPIPLIASATDPDNNISNIRVTATGNSFSTTIAQVNGNSLNTTWAPSQTGQYSLLFVVRDSGGLSDQRTVNITVNSPSPVSISGRIVDRNSVGIAGVLVELRNYPLDLVTIAAATTDNNGNYAIPNITTNTSYYLRASKEDYTFSPQRRTYLTLNTTQTNADFTGTLQVQSSDFDGDRRSDFAVWRPSSGMWHVTHSSDNAYYALPFGEAALGDIVTPGNYDGDKKIDYAFYRNGVWNIINSSTGQVRTAQFGVAGDVPVPGDYDGDGKTDLAVWRNSNGVWYIQRSSDGTYDVRQFGLGGDRPLNGDYDGDGMSDVAIWRPSNGGWYIWLSGGGYVITQFGMQGDIPTVGDFDGDRKADITIFRPSNGIWFVIRSLDGNHTVFPWGLEADKPVPGDYDRDGKTDFAVFREAEGNWYVFISSTNSYLVQRFGMAGDIPIPAAYGR